MVQTLTVTFIQIFRELDNYVHVQEIIVESINHIFDDTKMIEIENASAFGLITKKFLVQDYTVYYSLD